jgi:hypothetical protein
MSDFCGKQIVDEAKLETSFLGRFNQATDKLSRANEKLKTLIRTLNGEPEDNTTASCAEDAYCVAQVCDGGPSHIEHLVDGIENSITELKKLFL